MVQSNLVSLQKYAPTAMRPLGALRHLQQQTLALCSSSLFHKRNASITTAAVTTISSSSKTIQFFQARSDVQKLNWFFRLFPGFLKERIVPDELCI
jgi:hypothetical protein